MTKEQVGYKDTMVVMEQKGWKEKMVPLDHLEQMVFPGEMERQAEMDYLEQR